MTTLFLVCAVAGGTILLVQVALLLIGLGGEALDVDMPDDVGDVDLDVDVDVDVDLDADIDVDAADHVGDVGHAETLSMFRVLSFRTVVAALTFFGLAGLAAQAAGARTLTALVVAVLAGATAMYAVFWIMQWMRKLQAEGTVRLRRAVGRPATVYVPIPANKSGTGKIQLSLQNRTMEYLAMTPGDRLSTGAKVVVTSVITPDTVEVQPAPESERSDNV